MFGKRKTILYVMPHPNEDLMTFGVDICAQIRKKQEVHVLVCTQVESLNRDAELIERFTHSCMTLGISSANIHIPGNRGRRGSLKQEKAEELIRSQLEVLGEDVLLCAPSSNNGPGQHWEHKAVGRAADALLRGGVVREVKFFVEPEAYRQVCENPRLTPVALTVRTAKENDAQKLAEAGRLCCQGAEYPPAGEELRSAWFMMRDPAKMTFWNCLEERHLKWRKLLHQKQLYYSSARCEAPELGGLHAAWVGAGQTEEYRAFCEKNGYALREKDVERIRDGSSFWCLIQGDGTIVSTGWLACRQQFYIGEIDYGFHMGKSGTGLLFDFNTKPEHRGRGYYPLLLRTIMSRAEGPERYMIYTAPDNTASARGILKAGFSPDGEISAANGTAARYLRRAGFCRLWRKYRLWGLWYKQ